MNHTLANLYFKLKIYEKSGNEFQHFFSRLMGHVDPNFTPIKPHGNWGDGGNDGCNMITRHYYQIFAPLATTRVSPIDELNKAIVDYHKLLSKWKTVDGYSFVINDRFTGISALLLNSFVEFKDEKHIEEGEVIGAAKMHQIFNTLDSNSKLDVLDMYSLDTEGDSFEPSIVGELIRHLIENSEDSLTFLSDDAEAPNFEEKIKFNKISARIGQELTSNSSKVYLIEDFISAQNDDGIAQDLANKVKDIYRELCRDIPLNEPSRSELIYLGIKEALVPDFAKTNKLSRLGYDSVAKVIIAKYFETCDVYEDPNKSNS